MLAAMHSGEDPVEPLVVAAVERIARQMHEFDAAPWRTSSRRAS